MIKIIDVLFLLSVRKPVLIKDTMVDELALKVNLKLTKY